MLLIFFSSVWSPRGFHGWAAVRPWWRSTWPFSATWCQRRLSTCVLASRWSSPTSLPVGPQTCFTSSILNSSFGFRSQLDAFTCDCIHKGGLCVFQGEWPSARGESSSPTQMTKTRVGHFKSPGVWELRSAANNAGILFFRPLQELRPVSPGFAAHLQIRSIVSHFLLFRFNTYKWKINAVKHISPLRFVSVLLYQILAMFTLFHWVSQTVKT